MRRKLQFSFLIAVCLLTAGPTCAQTVRSVYTTLEEKQCGKIKSIQADEDGYLGHCPGVAGYSLVISEGDLRQNLTVVTPKKKEHSLDLWSIVSSAFSHLGPKAEWRVKGQTPVALIFRYNASEDTEHPDKTTSYLVVTKITPTEICATDKIGPGPRANEEARRLADESSIKACLKGQ